jgi:hypothetical protein
VLPPLGQYLGKRVRPQITNVTSGLHYSHKAKAKIETKMRASGLFSYGGSRERNDLGLDRHQQDNQRGMMVEECGGAKMPF